MVLFKFYRFADRAEFEATCAAAGIEIEAPPERITLDVIGEIERDGVPVAGYHVNAAWNEIDEAPAFAAFSVIPSNPVRVFAQRIIPE